MSKNAMLVFGALGIVCFVLLMSLDAWNNYRILNMLAARGTLEVIFLYAFPLLTGLLLVVVSIFHPGED